MGVTDIGTYSAWATSEDKIPNDLARRAIAVTWMSRNELNERWLAKTTADDPQQAPSRLKRSHRTLCRSRRGTCSKREHDEAEFRRHPRDCCQMQRRRQERKGSSSVQDRRPRGCCLKHWGSSHGRRTHEKEAERKKCGDLKLRILPSAGNGEPQKKGVTDVHWKTELWMGENDEDKHVGRRRRRHASRPMGGKTEPAELTDDLLGQRRRGHP